MIALIVWATIECIDSGSVRGQMLLQPGVQLIDFCARIPPERNPALVGHHDDPPTGTIQGSDRHFRTRKKLEALPLTDVFSFRRLPADDTLAIEEHVTNVLKSRLQSNPSPSTPRAQHDLYDGNYDDNKDENPGSNPLWRTSYVMVAVSHLMKSTLLFEQIFGHAIAGPLSRIESLGAERAMLKRIASR